MTKELRDLGLRPTQEVGGASFRGEMREGMRVALSSRIAGGLVRRIGSVRAATGGALVGAVRNLGWASYVHPAQQVEVRAVGSLGRGHRGSIEGAVRKGIAEALRGPRREGGRPPRSGAAVLVRAVEGSLEISLDACGERMHMRGWRKATAQAPLRENLACAVLELAGWEPGTPLVDPMCGSGTFPIEAGRLALGIEPGSRRRFAFEDWPCADARAWETLRARGGERRLAPILGCDRDARAIEAARGNLGRSGASSSVKLACMDVLEVEAPADSGVLVCNPPWGLRVGGDGARQAWERLGQVGRERFSGWRIALLGTGSDHARATGLPLQSVARFRSGGQSVVVWIGAVP